MGCPSIYCWSLNIYSCVWSTCDFTSVQCRWEMVSDCHLTTKTILTLYSFHSTINKCMLHCTYKGRGWCNPFRSFHHRHPRVLVMAKSSLDVWLPSSFRFCLSCEQKHMIGLLASYPRFSPAEKWGGEEPGTSPWLAKPAPHCLLGFSTWAWRSGVEIHMMSNVHTLSLPHLNQDPQCGKSS